MLFYLSSVHVHALISTEHDYCRERKRWEGIDKFEQSPLLKSLRHYKLIRKGRERLLKLSLQAKEVKLISKATSKNGTQYLQGDRKNSIEI